VTAPKTFFSSAWRLGLLTVLAWATTPLHAELTARLSSTKIDETQTLELTIRTDSRDVQGMPDLQAVARDFEILTTRTSSQYRVSNGNVQAWTDWVIALRPLRVGTLSIPALSYRGEQTQPLQLQVVPLDPKLKKQMGDRVFFEVSTEPETPYVQAQLVFVRRLLYADGTQIYGEMPDTPVVENAVVIPLGNASSSQVTRNDKRYGMIEQRYALFPERSGELTIPGATVSGSVRMNINGRLRRNGVRIVAEPVTLDVRPIPEDYPADTPWLPATRVDLLEDWDQTPPTFSLGEPHTQTLIVRADAATGSIIPPLDYGIPDSHFRSYPEQPDISDNQRGDGLIGTRSQTWSIIPTTAGSIRLPMIELTWFDTVREEVRVSRLPSRAVTVGGGNGDQVVSEPEQNPAPVTDPAPEEPLTAADRSVFGTTGAVLLSLLLAAALFRAYPWLRAKFSLPTPEFSWLQKRLGLKKKRWKQKLLDTAAEGSASDIRNELDEALRDMAQDNTAWDPQAQESIYDLLSSAAYSPTPTDLDRVAIASEVEFLLNPGRRSASKGSKNGAENSNSALPALYPS